MAEISAWGPREGKVYNAMGMVMQKLKALAKTERNTSQGYSYRGIDSLLNKAHGILEEAKLVVLPHVLNEPEITLGPVSKKGTQYYRSLVKMSFEFLSTEDGSSVLSGPFIGEGIDAGDKATNCAQTAAYKYCFFETFCMAISGGLADSEKATEIDDDIGGELESAFTGGHSKQATKPPQTGQKPATGQQGQPGGQIKGSPKDAEHRDELQAILFEVSGGIEQVELDCLRRWSEFKSNKPEDNGKMIWARDVGKLSGKWLNMILEKGREALKQMQNMGT